ncbi:MAG TPA: precorrin-3B synthase [Xanthobacteraceae bacterium]|nr:precorrin-3B synthase [Xanthobacteraceae bacterium]
MNPAGRRGACPTLPAPMATGDGLLARFSPLAPLSRAQVAGLAAAARAHGNGIVQVTARGSLQVRGLDAPSAPRFTKAVDALGIVVRTGLGIEVGPLAGRDGAADPRPLADAIARAAAPFAGLLAPKLAVVVDGGGALHLDALPADIRLRALGPSSDGLRASRTAEGRAGIAESSPAPDPGSPFAAPAGMTRWRGEAETTASQPISWQLSVADTVFGAVPAEAVAELVARLLAALATKGPMARASDHVAALRAAVGPLPADRRDARPLAEPVGRHALADGRFALGLAPAFGQTERLGDLAALVGAGGLVAAPGRAFLLLGLDAAAADAAEIAAEALGFIVRADDPRRRVVACPGGPACASGRLPALALAAHLAPAVGAGLLHVSGCAKGCAHPGVAELTLVGLDGGAGLVLQGTARDAPARIVPLDEAAGAARRLLEELNG